MGRLFTSAIAAILFMVLYSSAYSQTAAKVTIEKIEENSSISGHVEGLDRNTARGHRVVVYVHTDKWYIHPYAGLDEGKSWSSISDDGSWSVETVKRDFPADEIAALVVSEGYEVPAQTSSLQKVNNIAMFKKRLKGTDDYKKL